MDLRKKNIVYTLVLVGTIALVWWLRRDNKPEESVIATGVVQFRGQTMGTYYSVKYLDAQERNFKAGIDSVLIDFNNSLSTYIEDSEISLFNQQHEFSFQSTYFLPVLQASSEVYETTDGAFDPTIMPLVNAWGFGPEGPQMPDEEQLQALLKLVNYKLIVFDDEKVTKKVTGVQLDFSAIAKGYGADVVAAYLTQQGIQNLMVEIGGEVVARGKNANGEWWRIGIENPVKSDNTESRSAIFSLANKAMATSGNYKNFYMKDGKKYAHTLSPKSGYPVEHNLLSATVFAADCMTADAYATAFMVMGTEKAIELAGQLDEIDIFLIYTNEQNELATYTSNNIKEFQIQ